MTGRLPNFLYVGTDKAGSSWLHEVLIRHPQIFMTQAKDLYFFDRYYDRGIDWYREQFRSAGPEQRVVGEFCQDYLYGDDAPARIRRDLGEIRLMVTLRDPVQRAFSSYLYLRSHGVDLGTFRQALMSTDELLERGRYASYLRRFLACFPREQLYISVFEDLASDPQAYVDNLCSWLDVDVRPIDDSLLEARLPASRSRSMPAARLIRHGAAWMRDHDHAEAVGRVKRSLTVQRVLYKSFGVERPTVAPEDVAFIQSALSAEVEQAGALMGEDLTRRWGWA